MISFSGSSIGGAGAAGTRPSSRKYEGGIRVGWEGGAGLPMLSDCIRLVSGTSDIRPPCALIRSNVAPKEPPRPNPSVVT